MSRYSHWLHPIRLSMITESGCVLIRTASQSWSPWFCSLPGEMWFLKGFSMSPIPRSQRVQAEENISACN
ncbi:unnamed protein product [Arctogadus glacialis]